MNIDYEDGYDDGGFDVGTNFPNVKGNQPAQPLTVVKSDGEIVPAEDEAETRLTPQEHRVNQVADALHAAYLKAGTLEMTDAEFDALTAPFPDECVEVLPYNGLIYIPHIHISNRIMRVFKGKWAILRRREWFERGTMYGEYVLIIRGVAIGESVGSAKMASGNKQIDYDDVLESTKGIALRRIAGKHLSCGSQVWEPVYSRAFAKTWVETFTNKNGKIEFRKRSMPASPIADQLMSQKAAQQQRMPAKNFDDHQPQKSGDYSPPQQDRQPAQHPLSPEETKFVLQKLGQDAELGTANLQMVWETMLSTEEKKACKPFMADIKAMAIEADKKLARSRNGA